MTRLAKRGPDLLLWVIWGCVIFNGFNAIAEYTNAHGLFPEPWGGYAMAVTVDGMLVYAFMTFGRSPVMGSILLGAAAFTTYMLQRWHAIMVGVDDTRGMNTLTVAAIVPGAMVLVTLAWHLIRTKQSVYTSRDVESAERSEPFDGVLAPVVLLHNDFDRSRRKVTDRTLLPQRPTKRAEPTAEPPKPNGQGSPRQRAMFVLETQPTLSDSAVAVAAQVSERTVRNAKMAMRPEGGTG